MGVEPVPKPRSRIVDEPTGVLVVIPSRAHWFVVLFLTAWLGGWAMGEISALRTLLYPEEGTGLQLFLLFWVVGWTLGGGFALLSLAWMLAGEERVRVRDGVLSIKADLLGFGRTRSYDLAQVGRLRVTGPRDARSRRWDLPVPGASGDGIIAFDYGAKTVRFGAGIDEAEARAIVEHLSGRFGIDREE